MNVQRVLGNGLNWARFVRGVKKFTTSAEIGGKAKWLFAALIALLLGINGLNVVNSYVGRDFMTAIESRSMADFIWQAGIYVGVFAASTLVAVFCRFAEERLGLLWREWLTARLVNRYLVHPTYYRLNDRMITNGQVANPDQRIADDVRAFTVTTLSFFLMLLNASFTVIAFAGVMWSISPLLFGVAVFYAVLGSFMTIFLGRPLVRLNYDQLDKEANFRADLIHVRENAESVALLRREGRLTARLLRHLGELTANFQQIIAVNRNLGFFTTGYNYLIQIIPALIVAPLFIRGQVEFGVITQSAMAFAHLLGAFSLVVTQFQSISSFAAVIARLGSLMEAIDRVQSTPTAIEVCEEEGHMAYERLTLRSPRDGRTLVKELSISIPRGTRVLILGPNETAKVALFRVTAGIWYSGEGRIIRPGIGQILFLPERPYLPPGTLREFLLRTGQEHVISEEQILATLRSLDLERIVTRARGLDVEQDWDDILSLGEQQLLAFARLFLAAPQFAFLDRIGTALNPSQVEQVLKMLSVNSITYLTLGHGTYGRRDTDDRLDNYDAVLELASDGGWNWKWIRAGKVIEEGALSS
jgi:putative ATP-binding cassette transporter